MMEDKSFEVNISHLLFIDVLENEAKERLKLIECLLFDSNQLNPTSMTALFIGRRLQTSKRSRFAHRYPMTSRSLTLCE